METRDDATARQRRPKRMTPDSVDGPSRPTGLALPVPLWAATAVTVFALGVGIGIGRTTTSAPNAQGSPAAAKGAEKVAAKAATAHLGQDIALHGPNGENVTAVLVGLTDPATGNSQHPDPGQRYVSARIRLYNHGTATWNGNGAPTIGAHLIDAAGQRYGPVIASTDAGQMFTSNVVIEPGQFAVGTVTFAIPDGTAVCAVQIVLDNGAGPAAQWTVG